ILKEKRQRCCSLPASPWAMVTPAPKGEMNPLVLAAAKRAGVDEIYRVGGAQAVAALAYGAGTVAPVDVIVGPGNAYVAEAKRQVFGQVGIDSVAGPSEILVVADSENDPQWIAADLLSQAEHDPSSQSILITDDAGFADKVAGAVQDQLAASPRREIAEAAWNDNSVIIVVPMLAEAPALVDRIAPEHLELAVANPEAMLAKVRHAGAIFLGRYAPEAVGDYVAGPDHVLPTARAARYASGLSVFDFLKRTSIIGCDEAALKKIGPAAARLADAEGLPSHAQSVRLRLKNL
ncbi:MAG: histidinol dehydrogenase, partial [Pseudomonadota bacterium]